MIEHYTKNTVGDDYAVGDIHGCFSRLKSMLDSIGFNPEVDRLFCAGDLIDRGPESHLVIEWLNHPWFFTTTGNHDQYIVESYEANDMFYITTEGAWFQKCSEQFRHELYSRIKQLPFMIEVETDNGLVGILHAENSQNSWADLKNRIKQLQTSVFTETGDNQYQAEHSLQQTMSSIIWSRTKFHNNNKTVISDLDMMIVGHNVVNSGHPLICGNTYYMDTGACFRSIYNDSNYRFSIINLNTKEIYCEE